MAGVDQKQLEDVKQTAGLISDGVNLIGGLFKKKPSSAASAQATNDWLAGVKSAVAKVEAAIAGAPGLSDAQRSTLKAMMQPLDLFVARVPPYWPSMDVEKVAADILSTVQKFVATAAILAQQNTTGDELRPPPAPESSNLPMIIGGVVVAGGVGYALYRKFGKR